MRWISQRYTLKGKGVKQLSQDDARKIEGGEAGGKDDHNINPGPVTLASIKGKTKQIGKHATKG